MFWGLPTPAPLPSQSGPGPARPSSSGVLSRGVLARERVQEALGRRAGPPPGVTPNPVFNPGGPPVGSGAEPGVGQGSQDCSFPGVWQAEPTRGFSAGET